MSLSASPASASPHLSTTPDTRLHGRWLTMARVGWGALVVFTLLVVFASLPVFVNHLLTTCAGPSCAGLTAQLPPVQARSLKELGLSLEAYATYTVALTVATLVLSLVVSTLIVWRRSHDRMAMLVALSLVTCGPISATATVASLASPWQVPTAGLAFLTLALIGLVGLLFPSGQFVPRWTRWIMVGFLVGEAPVVLFPDAPFTVQTHADQIGYLVLTAVAVLLAVVQLYRYRRVSSPLQRQQTKWVVFGIALPLTLYVGVTLPTWIIPALAEDAPAGALYQVALAVFYTGLPLFIPLAFGVALLRYRLWEIDTLINKALVYGLLTGLLGALYAGLIIGLESLAGLFIGGTAAFNPVVLVISTLAIAALFLPVRRRIQSIIDLRLYRKKYDAAKTLEAFSATLRQETDLEQIRAQLLVVVQETMQPAHVSLWLRPPERRRMESPHHLEPHEAAPIEPSRG